MAGDVLVFHFSGHGTTFDALDANGRIIEHERVEAICPFDYYEGKAIYTSDLSDIFAEMPHGVTLTCFLDCSYSGVITRVPSDARPPRARERATLPRFLHATPEMNAAFRTFQQKLARSGGSASTLSVSTPVVVFSAAGTSEVAVESAGHGEFSFNAARLLRYGPADLTNEQFVDAVRSVDGVRMAATPVLECPPAMRERKILAPLTVGAERGLFS